MRKRIFLVLGLFAVLFVFVLSAAAAETSSFVPLTGRVTDGSGNGIGGASITASGVIGHCGGWTGDSTLSSPFGYYTLSVPDNCYFIVSAAKKDWTFDPEYYNIAPLGTYDNKDFVGTHN
jgi:hypothetical protein